MIGYIDKRTRLMSGYKDLKKRKEYDRKWKRDHEKDMKEYYKKRQQEPEIKKRRNQLDKMRLKNDSDYRFKRRVREYTRIVFTKKDSCEKCNNQNNLEFHHKIYKLPVMEEDIMTLCKTCNNHLERTY